MDRDGYSEVVLRSSFSQPDFLFAMISTIQSRASCLTHFEQCDIPVAKNHMDRVLPWPFPRGAHLFILLMHNSHFVIRLFRPNLGSNRLPRFVLLSLACFQCIACCMSRWSCLSHSPERLRCRLMICLACYFFWFDVLLPKGLLGDDEAQQQFGLQMTLTLCNLLLGLFPISLRYTAAPALDGHHMDQFHDLTTKSGDSRCVGPYLQCLEFPTTIDIYLLPSVGFRAFLISLVLSCVLAAPMWSCTCWSLWLCCLLNIALISTELAMFGNAAKGAHMNQFHGQMCMSMFGLLSCPLCMAFDMTAMTHFLPSLYRYVGDLWKLILPCFNLFDYFILDTAFNASVCFPDAPVYTWLCKTYTGQPLPSVQISIAGPLDTEGDVPQFCPLTQPASTPLPACSVMDRDGDSEVVLRCRFCQPDVLFAMICIIQLSAVYMRHCVPCAISAANNCDRLVSWTFPRWTLLFTALMYSLLRPVTILWRQNLGLTRPSLVVQFLLACLQCIEPYRSG